ncbi:hypothetical protein OG897_31035 [Streptomyces sp. NBC_00237]|uniref:nuclear transport factor 2 family protein n=1 Tax=Streptomyces sp. NBC_00237 TaxID=2975687 RepID=UPI002255D7EB|nr:nuclear transport factor 2 family protein [Streptomyces sp. NBC_00237]MCX5205856.1 hypothetical protein [Streptomyces sp. NBC_00237]
MAARAPQHHPGDRQHGGWWPLAGHHQVGPPALVAGDVHPGDVVGRYQTALDAQDTEPIVRSLSHDGSFREPGGPQYTHRCTDELPAFFTMFFSAGGGIGLQHRTVTHGGTRCAVEYNCVRWGTSELPPQAGTGVCGRGPDGLLTAARVYDDVQAPVEKS